MISVRSPVQKSKLPHHVHFSSSCIVFSETLLLLGLREGGESMSGAADVTIKKAPGDCLVCVFTFNKMEN